MTTTTTMLMPTDDSDKNGLAERIAGRIGRHKFNIWFGHSTDLHIADSTLVVRAENRFVADSIKTKFGPELHEVAVEVIGQTAKVEIRETPDLIVQSDCRGRSPEPHHPAGRSKHHPARRPDSLVGGRKQAGKSRRGAKEFSRTLENFVVGPSNELAYNAACRLADPDCDADVSPLFLHGECGVGKTHLLQGICRRFCELTGRPDYMRYVTGEQFTNEYIMSVQGGTRKIEQFRKRYRRLELLAIDDVHFLANKVSTQKEFLHTIDEIGLSGARIALASDEHPRHIQQFSNALISRFLSGMVAQIQRPDRTMRIELVRRLSSQRKISLNDAALELIAERGGSSIREIEGTIATLCAMASIQNPVGEDKREIGLTLVKQLFDDGAGWRPRSPVRMDVIINSVCTRLGIERHELNGDGRHRRVVLARGLVAFLGRELTTMSFPEIARALGKKHHSTIITACRRITREMELNPSLASVGEHADVTLRDLVDELRHEIRQRTE